MKQQHVETKTKYDIHKLKSHSSHHYSLVRDRLENTQNTCQQQVSFASIFIMYSLIR
jgi:hypothetical protein